MPSAPAYLQFDGPISRAIWPAEEGAPQTRIESVAAGQSIAQALEALGVGLPRAAVVLVNGSTCDLGFVLQPGDQVRFLFQISGG
jgi:sulfur carrier protein ThiS